MEITPTAEQAFGVRLAWCRDKLTGFAAYHDAVLKAKADEAAYQEKFRDCPRPVQSPGVVQPIQERE